MYDETGLSDDCPRKYTPRDVLNLLVEKLAYWCNGDLSYDEKYDHYYGQNLLAQSLHEQAYTHDPGFRRFVDETGLPFRAQSEFKKAFGRPTGSLPGARRADLESGESAARGG